jgi:hypothetical protein
MEHEMRLYKPINISDLTRDVLYDTLRESRQLDTDTEKMLGVAELKDSEKRIAFDGMRKNYPTRHEKL